ncbi:uncharacterized protein LOC144377426 [Ictidomys tridecemlineatus]
MPSASGASQARPFRGQVWDPCLRSRRRDTRGPLLCARIGAAKLRREFARLKLSARKEMQDLGSREAKKDVAWLGLCACGVPSPISPFQGTCWNKLTSAHRVRFKC